MLGVAQSSGLGMHIDVISNHFPPTRNKTQSNLVQGSPSRAFYCFRSNRPSNFFFVPLLMLKANWKCFLFNIFSRTQISEITSWAVQPRPQGLLGVQNGGSEKALANSRSCVHKLANNKAHCHFETTEISDIFGDTWPAVCQGLLRAAILTSERILGRRLRAAHLFGPYVPDKYGPLREPIRMLLFTMDQFSHIIIRVIKTITKFSNLIGYRQARLRVISERCNRTAALEFSWI